jgi:hypothetical protein
MLDKTLAHYIGVPPAKIARLLALTQQQIYSDAEYKSWLEQLDSAALYATLPHARQAYETHLPHFAQILEEKYHLSRTPMSAFTLGNWLVGFLEYHDKLIDLSKMHGRLPRQAVIEMLPDMIGMLDDMPQGRADWQKALALMALPLAAVR